jgi:excisionase family DNA binding protein
MLDQVPELPSTRLLEVYEVAYYLRCSQETVRRLVRTRQLAAVHLGAHWRVKKVDLDAFEAAQRTSIAREERALDQRLHQG